MTKVRILVVDDDLIFLKFIKKFYKSKFIIDTCGTPEEFYEKLNENSYDLFIIDISLKTNITGLELTSYLRSQKNYSDKPIIILTAHTLRSDELAANKVGADIFIKKPASLYDLTVIIERLISKNSLANNSANNKIT